MSTSYKDLEVIEKIKSYPVFNGMDNNELVHLDENSNVIRNNPKEKAVQMKTKIGLGVVSIAVIAGIVMMLPLILKTLSLMLLGIGMVGLIMFAWIMFPQVLRWTKSYADKLYREDIRRNQGAYLDQQVKKAKIDKRNFSLNKSSIKKLKDKFEISTLEYSEEVVKHQDTIRNISEKTEILQEKMKEIEANEEEPWLNETYNEYDRKLKIILGEFEIINQKMKLAESLGLRSANKFKEMIHTVRRFEEIDISLDIHISKLVATTEMIKAEVEQTKSEKEATGIARNVLGSTADNSSKFIIDIVAQKLEQDSAIISANIEEIGKATSELGLSRNEDESINKLKRVMNEMNSGSLKPININDYKNPNYIKTTKDKIASGPIKGIIK